MVTHGIFNTKAEPADTPTPYKGRSPSLQQVEVETSSAMRTALWAHSVDEHAGSPGSQGKPLHPALAHPYVSCVSWMTLATPSASLQ